MRIDIDKELLERLAPAQPMNQDEQGGCVWCGGGPPGEPYGYAEADPTHHALDCPWIHARATLAQWDYLLGLVAQAFPGG